MYTTAAPEDERMSARQQEQRSRMIEENIGLVHACAHRFKGKGMPYVGYKNRGDQLVTVVVETPTRLTREQKELLRRFDESAEGANAKKKSFAEKMKKLFE